MKDCSRQEKAEVTTAVRHPQNSKEIQY